MITVNSQIRKYEPGCSICTQRRSYALHEKTFIARLKLFKDITTFLQLNIIFFSFYQTVFKKDEVNNQKSQSYSMNLVIQPNAALQVEGIRHIKSSIQNFSRRCLNNEENQSNNTVFNIAMTLTINILLSRRKPWDHQKR